MRWKGISTVALFFFSAVMFGTLPAGRSARALDAEAAAVVAAQESILSSTMTIEMFGRGRIEGGVKHVSAAQGLGTLVEEGSQRFVITHNHWSVPATELDRVELRTTAGERLLVLEAATFLSLVRYQDWGTMLFEAPQQLQGIAAAALGDGSQLAGGDSVWLVAQDAGMANAVGLATARVESVDVAVTPGLIALRGSDGAVVAGDSGGGIWHDGRLVGNLWAITVAPAPPSWRQWFGGASDWHPTGQILVGMQPLHGAAGLMVSDLAPVFDEQVGYERGPQR